MGGIFKYVRDLPNFPAFNASGFKDYTVYGQNEQVISTAKCGQTCDSLVSTLQISLKVINTLQLETSPPDAKRTALDRI